MLESEIFALARSVAPLCAFARTLSLLNLFTFHTITVSLRRMLPPNRTSVVLCIWAWAPAVQKALRCKSFAL